MRVINLELPSGSASFHILIPYMLIEPDAYEFERSGSITGTA